MDKCGIQKHRYLHSSETLSLIKSQAPVMSLNLDKSEE